MLFFIAFGINAIILWLFIFVVYVILNVFVVKKIMENYFLFFKWWYFCYYFYYYTYDLAVTINIFKSINSTSCSIFKFITEIVEGQSKTTISKWSSIYNVQTILSNLSIFIYNARNNSVESFKDDKDEMQTTQNNFDTSLTTPSYTDSNGISITETNYWDI